LRSGPPLIAMEVELLRGTNSVVPAAWARASWRRCSSSNKAQIQFLNSRLVHTCHQRMYHSLHPCTFNLLRHQNRQKRRIRLRLRRQRPTLNSGRVADAHSSTSELILHARRADLLSPITRLLLFSISSSLCRMSLRHLNRMLLSRNMRQHHTCMSPQLQLGHNIQHLHRISPKLQRSHLQQHKTAICRHFEY